MKIKLFATVAAAIAIAAAPLAASAAAIDVNYGNANLFQQNNGPTFQAAGAAALAIGDVKDYSDVAADAVNADNVASMTVTVADSSSWLGSLDAGVASVNQFLNNSTMQIAGAVAASGGVANNSSLTASATNAANAASIDVSVGCSC